MYWCELVCQRLLVFALHLCYNTIKFKMSACFLSCSYQHECITLVRHYKAVFHFIGLVGEMESSNWCRPLPNEDLQAAGPTIHAAATTNSGWPDRRIQYIYENTCFPYSLGLRDQFFEELQGPSRRLRAGSVNLIWVVEYYNCFLAFVAGSIWNRCFPHISV